MKYSQECRFTDNDHNIIVEVLRRKNWNINQLSDHSGYTESYLHNLRYSSRKMSRKMHTQFWIGYLGSAPEWEPQEIKKKVPRNRPAFHVDDALMESAKKANKAIEEESNYTNTLKMAHYHSAVASMSTNNEPERIISTIERLISITERLISITERLAQKNRESINLLWRSHRNTYIMIIFLAIHSFAIAAYLYFFN